MQQERIPSPIFIGGLIKSGTSLLRAMLGQHSKIAAGLETYWFDMRWPSVNQQDTNPALPGRVEVDLDLQVARLANFFGIDESEAHLIRKGSPDPETFLDRFMACFTEREKKARWLEKTPGNLLHLGRIVRHWPDVHIVVCLRDPRDVFASCRKAGRWEDVDVFGDLWTTYHSAYTAAKRNGHIHDGNTLEVRYEDLIRDPAMIMQRISAFLGEDFEPVTATYLGDSRDYEKVLSVTGKKSTTLERMCQPLNSSRIGIHSDVVSPKEVRALREQAAKAGLVELWDQLVDEDETKPL